MNKTKVAIIGGSGFLAAELLRHLLPRDDTEVIRISSKDRVGETVGAVNRSLWGQCDLVLEDIDPRECARGAELVFLAMPHKITAEVAERLFDLDVRIIDLSGDFRLQSAEDYSRFYGEHPSPERLGQFIYGMPELNRKSISAAQYVANPGCFATCISASVLPLAKSGLLDKTTLKVVAMTGSSGSGVHAQAGNHHTVRCNNIKAYKSFEHQHTPEIIQTLKLAGAKETTLDFIPVSAPLTRGMMSISQFDLKSRPSLERLRTLYTDYYKESSLISVLPAGMAAEVVAVKNTCRMEISIERNENGDGYAVVTVLDNLIKGGAGQAIQNYNLMIGKNADFGLNAPGIWP